MRGTAKSKVLTSGRLTGGVKGQLVRRRATPNPAPAACPEPTYSLYSTDSEDQVTSLHAGLDRCAALLGGILQAEKAEALPGSPRAVKGGAAKSKPSTSQGKKITKNTKTDQRTRQSQRRSGSGPGPGSVTPRTTHQCTGPAAHSQVQLHPPQKQPPRLLQSHLPPPPSQTLQHLPLTNPSPQPQTSIPSPQLQTSFPPSQPQTSMPSPLPQTSIPSPQLQTSFPPSQPQTSMPSPLPQTSIPSPLQSLPQTDCQAECDREEELFPVRDIDTRSAVADMHSAVRLSPSHIHTTCTLKANMQLEPGQPDKVLQDTHSGEDCSAETGVKMRTVQYLLGELKALIAGQGSAAERLLSHLEQTMCSPPIDVGSPNVQTDPDLSSLRSQNAQLRRRVRLLNQQLKEREEAERQQNMEAVCNSEVLSLQEELATAQTRLQDLQGDLTGLREALQDTQNQLVDREAENTLIRTDLEATRSRLLDSEREKCELVLLAQQRLEEIGNLNRILGSHDLSSCPTVVDTLPAKQHFNQQQRRQDPAEPSTDRIAQFLMSLGQLDPTHTEHVAAERNGNTPEQKKLTSGLPRDTLSHPGVRSHRGDKPADCARHRSDEVLEKERRRLSQCDVESLWSDWSMRSGSTFDTRDEAAFRDGLAALDASIASLQKTIQLDLGR